jgi:outer membrane biosynthesis protein TonB
MRRFAYFLVALVLTVALIFGVQALAGMIFNAKPPAKPAVAIPEVEKAKEETKEEAAAKKEEPKQETAAAGSTGEAAKEEPKQEAAAEDKPAEEAKPAEEPKKEETAAAAPAPAAGGGAGDQNWQGRKRTAENLHEGRRETRWFYAERIRSAEKGTYPQAPLWPAGRNAQCRPLG